MSPFIEAEIKKKTARYRTFKRQPSASSRLNLTDSETLVTELLRKAERIYAVAAYRNMKFGGSPDSSGRFLEFASQVAGKRKHTKIPDLIDLSLHPSCLPPLARRHCSTNSLLTKVT